MENWTSQILTRSLCRWKLIFRFGLYREEVFGPVAPLMRFHSDEEAIKMANDTEFGMYIISM